MQGNGAPRPMRPPVETRRVPVELPKVLDLEIDPPIDWNNNTYSTLHLEEPTARMVHRAESEFATDGLTMANMTAYKTALVSHASGLPRQVIDNLRITQLNEAYRFLTVFIAAGPPTGET